MLIYRVAESTCWSMRWVGRRVASLGTPGTQRINDCPANRRLPAQRAPVEAAAALRVVSLAPMRNVAGCREQTPRVI
jgi:hypothetical protein